ncbi:radical SAM/SPASM domain-containing protein [Candidatus Magnetominusculus dajiuhuensis]|uniref:radical SAM/SPASM domain-containing protein n=1 Tax=Candidatus Magnetominusculus dajiuhuensis TaxID=3137712 RepID=UPI003B428C43
MFSRQKDYFKYPEGLDTYIGNIIGGKYMEYRRIWDQVTRQEILTDFPLFVLVETQHACNYHCTMCYKSDKVLSDEVKYAGILSSELFEKVVDEMIVHNSPALSLNNSNEPLLDKNIIDRLAYASKKGIMDIMMNTNALLLDEDISRGLIDNRLTKLLVSIDAATEKTYSLMRSSRSDSFKKVLSNTDKFLEIREKLNSKLPILRVSFVVTKLNEHEQEAFLNQWKDRADHICFQRYTAPTDTARFLDIRPVILEEEEYSCSNPFERIIIRGDGNAYPCCYTLMNESVGNIKVNSLYEIWHSSKMEKYRKIVTERNWKASPYCDMCSKNTATLS